jgi:hypothetical protein
VLKVHNQSVLSGLPSANKNLVPAFFSSLVQMECEVAMLRLLGPYHSGHSSSKWQAGSRMYWHAQRTAQPVQQNLRKYFHNTY